MQPVRPGREVGSCSLQGDRSSSGSARRDAEGEVGIQPRRIALLLVAWAVLAVSPTAACATLVACSAIDLSPPGLDWSGGRAASGGAHAGWGMTTAARRREPVILLRGPCGLRSRSASSWLHGLPVEVPTLGSRRGAGRSGQAHPPRLWSGTDASVVDLHPGAAYLDSQADGICGARQVGSDRLDGAGGHAALWTGATANHVDLHPTGFFEPWAFATDGSHQVGNVQLPFGGELHALMWSGLALTTWSRRSGATLIPRAYDTLAPGAPSLPCSASRTASSRNGWTIAFASFNVRLPGSRARRRGLCHARTSSRASAEAAGSATLKRRGRQRQPWQAASAPRSPSRWRTSAAQAPGSRPVRS